MLKGTPKAVVVTGFGVMVGMVVYDLIQKNRLLKPLGL